MVHMDRMDKMEEAVVVLWVRWDCGAGDMMVRVGDQKAV